MIKTSNSPNPSKGFILLPLMIMLLSATLILIALSQEFYSHIRLEKETELLVEAQTKISAIIPKIETDLSLNISNPDNPNPIDQSQLLSRIETWPSIDNINTYNQLIRINSENLYYSSLINVSDNLTKQRRTMELISICSLAEHRCRPVELTLMQ